jgi:hypothetical protein
MDVIDIVYNCGYYSGTTIKGKVTGKEYAFRKRFVTSVKKEDAPYILSLTADNIQWCGENSREIPPFMLLEDWCAGKKGVFRDKNMVYDPKSYKEKMSL